MALLKTWTWDKYSQNNIKIEDDTPVTYSKAIMRGAKNALDTIGFSDVVEGNKIFIFESNGLYNVEFTNNFGGTIRVKGIELKDGKYDSFEKFELYSV